MYRPTANSYFTGGGGMDIGLQKAGIEIQQSLDLCKNSIDHLRANSKYFGHKIIHQDITGITVDEQPDADVMIGTYPCTKYSTIADIHGTRTGDDLYLHFFRHLAIKQPEVYLLENVPGMRKFPVVMEAMTRLPGYYINIFCPVNASCWLPQNRERLILIGTRKPFTISPPSATRRLSIKDIIEECPEYDLPDHVLTRVNGGYRDLPIIVDPADPAAMAPTCVAHYSKDQGTRLVKDPASPIGVRPFTIREYARLQGFPDDYMFSKNKTSYRIIGNAVPVPMAEWVGRETMRYFN